MRSCVCMWSNTHFSIRERKCSEFGQVTWEALKQWCISAFSQCGTYTNVPQAAIEGRTSILYERIMGCSHAPLEPNVTNGWVCTQASRRLGGMKWQGFYCRQTMAFCAHCSDRLSWRLIAIRFDVASFTLNLVSASVSSFGYHRNACWTV